MLKKIKTGFIAVGVSALAALFVTSIAVKAQLWPNFPILNGASYCASTVNGTCVQTIPAGPSMTGNETIPVDTNLSGGGVQTVKANLQVLGTGPYVYNVPLTGDTITLTNTTRQLIVNPAGTIANLTVVTPAASTLLDNQRLGLCTTQIVTSLTVTAGSGTTVSNAPTALLVPVTTGGASCVEWLYRSANTTWYRVQ